MGFKLGRKTGDIVVGLYKGSKIVHATIFSSLNTDGKPLSATRSALGTKAKFMPAKRKQVQNAALL